MVCILYNHNTVKMQNLQNRIQKRSGLSSLLSKLLSKCHSCLVDHTKWWKANTVPVSRCCLCQVFPLTSAPFPSNAPTRGAQQY